MDLQTILNVLLIIVLIIVLHYIYKEFIKKFTPEELGKDDFQSIGKFASPEWLDKALKKGLTKHEWLKEVERQKKEFDKELESRNK